MSLFEFPDTPTPGKPNRPAPQDHVHTSSVVHTPSRSSSKDVAYARLSNEDHESLRNMAQVFDEQRASIKAILDSASGLYGKRLGRASTLGDVLDGVQEKMRRRHPHVRGRIGEDLSVSQLKAFNKIVAAINAMLPATSQLEPVKVPKP